MNKLKTFILGLFLGISVFCGALNMHAENVTQKEAQKIAETFFNAAYGEYVTAPKLAWNGRQLTTNRLFSPFYIFNHPKGGFVIVSADSKAYPILGYSRTNRFERDQMQEDEKELLKQYAHEIELIRYDSRIPERAIGAWQNIPLYINKILHNPYDTPEFEALTDDRKDLLEAVDRRNSSIMLPSAVEFPIYNPENYRDYTLDDVTVEVEVPFKFYEDFIHEIEEEERTRAAHFEELISPTKPVIMSSGGGHYSIRYPENIKLVKIYDMNGAKKIERYFKNSEVINLDVSSLIPGFYALMALGENGKIFGMKVFR